MIPAHGKSHYRAKLNDALVRQIKIKYATTPATMRNLARQYGVNVTTINAILKGRTWKHVK